MRQDPRPIWISEHKLTQAREILKRGGSLFEASVAIGVLAYDLDLALWNATKRFEQ